MGKANEADPFAFGICLRRGDGKEIDALRAGKRDGRDLGEAGRGQGKDAIDKTRCAIGQRSPRIAGKTRQEHRRIGRSEASEFEGIDPVLAVEEDAEGFRS